MKNKSTAIAFLCTLFASSTVMVGHEALATTWWHRDSSFECFVDTYPHGGTSTSTTLGTTVQGSSISGLVNGDLSNTATLRCPIHESAAEPKTGIVTFHVEGMDESTTAGISSVLCVAYYNNLGGACGTSSSSSTSGTGHVTLTPGLGALDTTSFGYTTVNLPVVSLPESVVSGIYYSN